MAAYYLESFGCRASQADGDAIAVQLDRMGLRAAGTLAAADVLIVNTCTVTAEADRDARSAIRRAERVNPGLQVVVTGCYAQRAPAEIAALPGVAAVVGNSHKDQVASIARQLASRQFTGGPIQPDSTPRNAGAASGFVPLAALLANPAAEASAWTGPSAHTSAYTHASVYTLTGDIFAHTDFTLPSLPASALRAESGGQPRSRTRPTLKIQDGCGNRCTFCVIPSTRGNSRSLPAAAALDAVREFVDAGGVELVVSGINLGQWGRDLRAGNEAGNGSKARFADLLAQILETTALPRLRISSVEPMDWTEDLIALMQRWGRGPHPRLARHAHLPLQSGSDRILRRMHRRYRPWHYAERVAAIHAAIPEAAIGADVMVGFPGESEADFAENYDFLAAQPFTYLHLFPFSARPGTPAWELHRENPVPGAAVRERMAALQSLVARKNLAFRAGFAGKTLSAVTLVAAEPARSASHSAALTDNFLAVELDAIMPANTMLTVRIEGLTNHGLRAVPMKETGGRPEPSSAHPMATADALPPSS